MFSRRHMHSDTRVMMSGTWPSGEGGGGGGREGGQVDSAVNDPNIINYPWLTWLT